QALEGDIDTVHAFFLHSGHVRTEKTLPGSMDYYITKQREARFEAREIEIGATYAAIRDAEPDTEYWRMGHYLLPFFTMNAPGLLGIKNSCIAWVPLDDENTMVWNIGRLRCSSRRPPASGDSRPALTARTQSASTTPTASASAACRSASSPSRPATG